MCPCFHPHLSLLRKRKPSTEAAARRAFLPTTIKHVAASTFALMEDDIYLPATPSGKAPTSLAGQAVGGRVNGVAAPPAAVPAAVPSASAPQPQAKRPPRQRHRSGCCCLLLLVSAALALGFIFFLLPMLRQSDADDTMKRSPRRDEIESRLLLKVPDMDPHVARKIANAIDKHDDFDHPHRLRVRRWGFTELEIISHQGNAVKTLHFPRSRVLEQVVWKAIEEQQAEEFPVRREIAASYRRFFSNFPSLDGKPSSLSMLKERLDGLNSTERNALRAQLLEDFRWRLRDFDSFMRKRSRDMQKVLTEEWMPRELLISFAVFDLLCMPTWRDWAHGRSWSRLRPREPSSVAGRRLAAKWLLKDPRLEKLPVGIGALPDPVRMPRKVRLESQLRRLPFRFPWR